MKNFIKKIVVLVLILVSAISLVSCIDDAKQQENLIPEQDIAYSHMSRGNVIQDGKQAIFFKFNSTYIVTKMEYAGSLLDVNGNVIYTFDETLNFGSTTKAPEVFVHIDADLINKVITVSFTKIKAYTTDTIN